MADLSRLGMFDIPIPQPSSSDVSDLILNMAMMEQQKNQSLFNSARDIANVVLTNRELSHRRMMEENADTRASQILKIQQDEEKRREILTPLEAEKERSSIALINAQVKALGRIPPEVMQEIVRLSKDPKIAVEERRAAVLELLKKEGLTSGTSGTMSKSLAPLTISEKFAGFLGGIVPENPALQQTNKSPVESLFSPTNLQPRYEQKSSQSAVSGASPFVPSFRAVKAKQTDTERLLQKLVSPATTKLKPEVIGEMEELGIIGF